MDSPISSAVPGWRVSLAIVVGLVGLPAVYLAFEHHSSRTVQASAAPDVPQSVRRSVGQLEELAMREPNEANYLDLSQAYIDNKRYGRAIEVLTPIVRSSPKNAVAWNNLCVARTLQMEFNLALDACESGIRSNDQFPLLQNNLRWAQGERDKTVASLAEQEKTDPARRDSSFYLSEGLNQLHLGYYDQAIVAWRRVLQMDANNAAAWNNIGTARMMQHKVAEGRDSFRRANQLDPSNDLFRNNLAWADASLKESH